MRLKNKYVENIAQAEALAKLLRKSGAIVQVYPAARGYNVVYISIEKDWEKPEIRKQFVNNELVYCPYCQHKLKPS